MKTRYWAAWIAIGAVGAVGCTGSITPGDVGGSGSGGTTGGVGGGTSSSTGTGTPSTCPPPEPQKHRPQEVACAPSMPGQGTPATACTTDADCTMAQPGVTLAGKCGPSMVCDFNQCATDSDCGADAVCSCQGQTFGYAHVSFGSTCIPANCHADADCGAGTFCSPTVNPQCGGFYGTEGFYCRTCQDTCVNDSDCVQQNLAGYCAFDPTVGHWACGYNGCAG